MSTNSSKAKQPAKSDIQVTPDEGKIDTPVANQVAKPAEASEPANLEVESPSVAPTPAPEAKETKKIQTDVREKLSKKSTEENVFVPSNPVALEKAATEVAQEQGFELNRGTSIGARLMARSQKRV